LNKIESNHAQFNEYKKAQEREKKEWERQHEELKEEVKRQCKELKEEWKRQHEEEKVPIYQWETCSRLAQGQ
jgi:F0F1-type ATP synthase membrane subunit b/b'